MLSQASYMNKHSSWVNELSSTQKATLKDALSIHALFGNDRSKYALIYIMALMLSKQEERIKDLGDYILAE